MKKLFFLVRGFGLDIFRLLLATAVLVFFGTSSAFAFNMYPNSTIYVDVAAGLTATVIGQAETSSAGPLVNIT